MAPQPKNFDAQSLGQLSARIDAIVGRLRFIESTLRNPPKGGPRDIEMVFEKADTYIDYLDEWSQARERKMRGILKKLEKQARKSPEKKMSDD